jgi:peptidoglycan hydrolase-like protein with peptidoglycan-binding domain
MSKAITLMLLCGLACSVIAYGFISGSNSHQRHPAPQQGDAMLGDKEVGTLLAAASGAWRAARRAGTPSGVERTSATEVVILPAAKVRHFALEPTPMRGDRGSLAQELQRELARVGCYDGQINGVWTTSTRQAMKAFLERVNATLPITQPDGILLALVQGQRVKICGASCPSGQALTEDGRCTPTAILSREAQKDHAKKAILVTSGWSTTTTVAPKLPSAPFEGQMALAGPKTESTANVVKAELVQPARERSPTAGNSGRDWRSELWKRQQANR